ncbi:MAG: secondary thiamine-phosphate synthase enzyme YjbQ [Thermodesulfobacteriota bacterium]
MIRLDLKTTKEAELVNITGKISKAVKAEGFRDGAVLVFCPHTTAGITINENADPDVPVDILMKTGKLVERDDPDFRHMEGNSDGHVKSSLFGASETIIVEDGSLVLGTWQAIFFAEFDGPRTRKVFLKFISC